MKVAKPSARDGGCWGVVTLHVNSLYGGSCMCSKRPRQGFLTCHSHKSREADAQELRALLAQREPFVHSR